MEFIIFIISMVIYYEYLKSNKVVILDGSQGRTTILVKNILHFEIYKTKTLKEPNTFRLKIILINGEVVNWYKIPTENLVKYLKQITGNLSKKDIFNLYGKDFSDIGYN